VLYLSYRPGPPLNEFIDYLWLIEGGQSPRLEKILPCGTSELVINLKNNEIHIHDPNQPEQYRRFSGAVFSGTYSRAFICNALQHEAIMGVHFKAGGALPFLNAEANELANAHANLADLWGRSGFELHERLFAAVTHQQRFLTMESMLESRLHSHITRQLQMKAALKMVHSTVQFARGARAEVVLSNIKIPARARFSGKARGARLGHSCGGLRLFRPISFD
jgi:hypothetical protein